MIHDVTDDQESKSSYECLQCGAVMHRESNPGTCETCGSGQLRNRAKSLE